MGCPATGPPLATTMRSAGGNSSSQVGGPHCRGGGGRGGGAAETQCEGEYNAKKFGFIAPSSEEL